MEFQIQTIDNEIVHDFAFHLIQAIKWQNWWNGEQTHTYELVNIKYQKNNLIPIGSVEFIEKYIDDNYHIKLKPINVPTELFDYANRKILNGTIDDIGEEKVFVKTNEKIKGEVEILNKDDKHLLKGIHYQISEVIDIETEYRCFIYNNQLRGVHYYTGDFNYYLDTEIVNKMINSYTNQPIVWTLDVGVDDNNNTFVIEAHNFFSCGLYGFSDYKILPQMFGRTINEIIKNRK